MDEHLQANRTWVTATLEISGRDPNADTTLMAGRLQRTMDTLKQLVESEL